MTKKHLGPKQALVVVVTAALAFSHASAQFLDDFDANGISLDRSGANGWTFYTGDGSAIMDFVQSGKGYASINVDATKDKRGIWWALIRRRVSENMDLSLLNKPQYEFRVEARIRVSEAPRRVNLHLNTQRTTDFHSHLMEFDIPDTLNWHTISMTTHGFDAVPRDSVYGQLALMDWGLEKYRVDLDYFKADIVNPDSAGSDKGVQVPYLPPVPDPATFAHHIPAVQAAIIDNEYPDMNFKNWYAQDESGRRDLLTVSSTQLVIMRWNLSNFAGKKVDGAGLLELTTYSLQRSSDYMKDFGMVRVTEIMGGDPVWNRENVTYDKLRLGLPLKSVLNSQMIIDVNVIERRGSTNLITISNPVLQRMVDGKTLGLAICPLGAVTASFYAGRSQGGIVGARLHLNVAPSPLVPIHRDY